MKEKEDGKYADKGISKYALKLNINNLVGVMVKNTEGLLIEIQVGKQHLSKIISEGNDDRRTKIK